ncbi:MAG: selenide, water dikinase SelD [Proteobacteria bacterium]|nr:selenide, water dikinase SelD [Pseudomonadota bacterium]
MAADVPPVADIILIGGGHSHVQVLKSFGMNPLPGIRLTLITREANTLYSGMLPGYVAGHYQRSDIHIDLGPLTRFARSRLIVDEVVRLDAESRMLHLANHPPMRYDFLSINIGAQPQPTANFGVAVKPIGQFLPYWEAESARLQDGDSVVLIGGGAGGVELAMAMREVLPPAVQVTIVCRSLLAELPQAAREICIQALAEKQIQMITDDEPQSLDDGVLQTAGGRSVKADQVYWVTGVAASEWPGKAGLQVDDLGFIKVDQHLRSLSHPEIFATGDIAHLTDQERPKSGVFAVRAGPYLADNLRRAALGRRLRTFRPQQHFLKLLSLGDRKAVGSRGRRVVSGAWVWRWKDWIDRRFMRGFNVLPDMADNDAQRRRVAALRPFAGTEGLLDPMRCGGCAAKLGADPLRRVLSRLPAQNFAHVMTGIGDDAAVVRHADPVVLLTTDGFRSLLDDPYMFGRIVAHHSLNDLFAMGATPISALALATVPLMSEQMMEEDLFQLLSGAVDVLNASDVPLVGGHTAEGSELSLGLTLSGSPVEPVLHKGNLRVGDSLILTKSLGVGAMMAAYMHGKLGSDDLEGVLASMDQSNQQAALIVRNFSVMAATDVTGFGLLGHLAEMLRASGLGATVNIAALPLMKGARECVEQGSMSVLQTGNEAVLADFEIEGSVSDPRVRLAVDPQTSGGLLFAVPKDRSDACVQALVDAGYISSVKIGEVTEQRWLLTMQ